ncbi:hypothetical protein AB0C59_14560 [Streptomyces sp. NPDC048664]|uniref:hypothetical protein n=1 Tax=Streptomyces sp. NPDC048664 TaxID=3154505 RepID=UPI00343E3702
MKGRVSALLAALVLTLVPLATAASGADGPAVRLSASQAGTGGSVTVSGSGWRARTLVMILVCGQASPSRGVIGGTNSCANADGRAVTTDDRGAFRRSLPVSEPPVPCPCVVHVATVTGASAQADAVLEVAGHAVRPLPPQSSAGRLAVLTDTRFEGGDGLLTWFGAPPSRTLVFTVGNVGSGPVEDPVFQVGTAHGVFAPQWDEQQYHGTVGPGGKARIELPVELTAGAHGDYTVSVRYGGKVIAEQPWGVGRPWGVTLFWLLLCVVVPVGLFRVGMAVVDRLRPRHPGAVRHRRAGGPTLRLPRLGPRLPEPAPPTAPALPWFAPDSAPGDPAGRRSAPHEDSPPGPPSPADPAGPATDAGPAPSTTRATPTPPTRKGRT